MTRFFNSIPFSRDLAKTIAFYRDLVGVEPIEQYEKFVLFRDGLAFHDGASLHRYAFGDEGDGSPWGRENLVLYFVADDLDARFERISAEAPILHPIREVPHGERLFRCLDPDGHVVELGDGAHLSLEEDAPA